jgi:parvulin-like peptidyl-prolyl isomerase
MGRAMGQEFGEAVARVSGNTWQGPLPSSYGWHLVKVARRTEAVAPALSAVRDAVRRDWEEEQRKRLNAELYRHLLARYEVVIHPPASGDAQASVIAPADSSAR